MIVENLEDLISDDYDDMDFEIYCDGCRYAGKCTILTTGLCYGDTEDNYD